MKEAFKQLFYFIIHIDDVVYELLVMIENRLREAVEDREGWEMDDERFCHNDCQETFDCYDYTECDACPYYYDNDEE